MPINQIDFDGEDLLWFAGFVLAAPIVAAVATARFALGGILGE